jgi:hypothetical protein
MKSILSSRGRVSLALTALSLTIVFAACDDFLVAENPGAVEEPDVNSPAYVNLIANMAITSFQQDQDDATYWNAQLADEIYNRAVFVEEGQIDRRELYSEMSYITAFMYNPMQRARFAAEDAADRLKTILADSASRDIRVARALAYAGISYVYLGEMMCTVPIDLGAPKDPEEIFEDAVVRFEEAITIASDAKAYLQTFPTPDANALAATDSVRLFALVGAARAALNRNELPRARAFAVQVTSPFEFRAYYSNNTTGQRHRLFDRIGTTAFNGTMTNTPFLAMAGDPRVPRVTTGTLTGRPQSPPSYSTFNNTVAGAPFLADMSHRIASYLEAQYIIAEADGPTASTVTFIDQRRAAGLQTPVTLTPGVDDAAIMAELRDQRSRDFYLDNHRLGDLRRYKRYYSIDLFPKGAYPGSTSGQIYSEAADLLRTSSSCWPLPISEINANTNIPK